MKNNHESKLPKYAEELRARVERWRARNSGNRAHDLAACADFYMTRILRDAEIAQAAREFANVPDRALVTRALKRDALLALIAKESTEDSVLKETP